MSHSYHLLGAGALFREKWLLPQVNLIPSTSLCSLPRCEDGAAGYKRALTAVSWHEVSLHWGRTSSYLFPPSYSPVLRALLVPCLLEQAQRYQAGGEAASRGQCSAWSTACGNMGGWESSFPAFLLLTPVQVEPRAESIAGLCSLWMWLCAESVLFIL